MSGDESKLVKLLKANYFSEMATHLNPYDNGDDLVRSRQHFLDLSWILNLQAHECGAQHFTTVLLSRRFAGLRQCCVGVHAGQDCGWK